MISLTQTAEVRLRAKGIDPVLVNALANQGHWRQSDEGFLIPCTSVFGEQTEHSWSAKDGAEGRGNGSDPALWSALDSPSRTAFVGVGFDGGLSLFSMLFGVDSEGTLRRRPNLPRVLAELTPLVLPADFEGVALTWLTRQEPECEHYTAAEDLARLLESQGFATAFLALPSQLPPDLWGAEILVSEFVERCKEEAPGLEVIPLPLPRDRTVTSFLGNSWGHSRLDALAALLEYAQAMARVARALVSEGEES